MTSNKRWLNMLSAASVLALLAGAVLTVRTLTGMSRFVELARKKAADVRELTVLQQKAQALNALVAARDRVTAPPVPLPELVKTALQGRMAATRDLPPSATLPGWTAKRVGVVLTDVPGDDVGRLLEEAGKATPPWALLECTLRAAPVQGQLAKAELVFGMVERTLPASLTRNDSETLKNTPHLNPLPQGERRQEADGHEAHERVKPQRSCLDTDFPLP